MLFFSFKEEPESSSALKDSQPLAPWATSACALHGVYLQTSTFSHELHAAAQSPADYYVAVHEGLYWGYIGAMDEKNETITSQGTYTGFISLGCRASGSEGLILNT